MLPRTLGLGGGIVLAVGSIAGSGILFLPSTIYVIAGSDSLVVWVVAALLCVPLLVVFRALVHHVSDGSGLEGFVALGLGRRVSALVPTLLLVVFYPAMAAGMLVAGGYVSSEPVIRLAVALAIIAVTTFGALGGARGAARLQTVVVWTTLAAAIALVALTSRRSYAAISPSLSDFGAIAQGVLVAFWGFAGFENMTFVAGELRNPRRDYVIAVGVALGGYCVLAMALTANIAATIPRGSVDQLSGVAQLADYAPGGFVISVLAALLVQAGASSWVWGISRLLYSTARDGRMPRWFAALSPRGVPRRAILSLTVPGACATCVAAAWPALVLPFVTFASAVFVTLYALAVASFIAVRRRAARASRSTTPCPDRSPPGPQPAAGTTARS